MFILDTNVISELMRPQPDPAVFAWVAAQPRDSLFTTSVSEAEVFHGIGAMPEGRRRDGLSASAEALFDEEFAGRVLPFAGVAARRYGEIIAGRLTVGKPISSLDALIAAIAVAAGARMVTHNTRDFEGCGLTLIDPWTA